MNPKNGRTAKTGDSVSVRTRIGTEATEDQNHAAAIASLAYEKWQSRGCPEADDQRDWLDAELEVLSGGGSQASGDVVVPKSDVTS